MIEAFYENGETEVIEDFISKKGKPFSTKLVMGEDGKTEFGFE